MKRKTTAVLATLAWGGLTLAACGVIHQDFYVPEPTGSGSTSSSGGAMLCMPTATQPCYDGPPDTEGVGLCKAGSQTCAADGRSWGACEGEVVPTVEDCASGQDQNCDGKAPPCRGSLLWAKAFGNMTSLGSIGATCVAVDTSGDVLVGGSLEGTVDFGGGPLGGLTGSSIFLVKLDASGNHVWSKVFPGTGKSATATGIAVNSAGEVSITGYFTGSVDLGGGSLPGAGGGNEGAFVAKLDPEGGHIWSTSFAGTGAQSAAGIAADATGNVLVTGTFSGSMDFGGPCGMLTTVSGNPIFVTKFDPSGACLWAERFGDADNHQGASVATDTAGSVLVTGVITSKIDFGGPCGALTSAGGQDIFVAKLGASGACLWAERFGDAADQQSASVATGSAGSVFITGAITGMTDFGAPCGALTSAGGQDIFVAKLDTSGACLWAERFGNAADQHGASIATDASGEVVLTGAMTGQADFGDGPLSSAGGQDIFAAKLDASGGYLWAKSFGDPAAQGGTAIAADTMGNTFVTGDFSGSVDFGANTVLTSAAGGDIFVAKFGP